MSDLFALAQETKRRAGELGFDLAGIAPAEPSRYRHYFQQWLADGQAGEMGYLANRFAERTDPDVYLPGAKSVICVALNYHVEVDRPYGYGKIAQYALGDDYHEVIKPRLFQLADWLRQTFPGAQTKCAVDTAPVMEKDLAARAGIGWIGKNTCVINEKIGSWLFLGEVITTIPFPPDEPAIDRCGTCTRCIDACPTHAITAPYQLDARRCISYLTIEHRNQISADLQPAIGDWIYGCDICQDVCPWNRRAPETTEPRFQPRFEGGLDLRELLGWRPTDFNQHLRGSAMKRVKLPILQRNAKLAAGNQLSAVADGHVRCSS
ncbi:MAG TPA: tRNA epoxyqueuosine(34) reductase QueG [Tepidisphaeraceae bacterium]|nr:tRNA epoxyqueuosine(34) reductase QueG [Tepidisphaeraceae bacterium]